MSIAYAEDWGCRHALVEGQPVNWGARAPGPELPAYYKVEGERYSERPIAVVRSERQLQLRRRFWNRIERQFVGLHACPGCGAGERAELGLGEPWERSWELVCLDCGQQLECVEREDGHE